MMRIGIVIGIALALAGCDSAPPVSQSTTANGVSTSLIAVVDGCNVWAIDRGGMTRTVYMARCPEGAADVQSSFTEQVGKTIQTIDQQTIGAR